MAATKRELKERAIRVAIPRDFPLLLVDGFLLEQVFVNLLENASRYTPDGSAIEITAAVVGKSAQISIIDNGPGIPAGGETKIFDKFFRGSSIAPDGRRGVGLGLAICRAIVAAHGGKITAANRPAGGAEFRIVLPCDAEPPKIRDEELSVSASA